jgi:hypothetical protein
MALSLFAASTSFAGAPVAAPLRAPAAVMETVSDLKTLANELNPVVRATPSCRRTGPHGIFSLAP